MKCIDLTKDGHAVPPVDDLATLALDLWAEEQGYTRHQPNMFLLS
jgi:FdhE protein